MSTKTTEIEALKQIDILFTDLSDEEQGRIIDFICAKYKISTSKIQQSQHVHGVEKQMDTKEIQSSMSIKEFLNLKKPEGFYERITCLAYYLEKIQGLEGFKTYDITQANKDARLSPMSNPTFFVNDATTKYGYLTPIGSGSKALSAKGEALVEALPEREKVKQVLESFPIKKKSIKKRGPKKSQQIKN